LELSIFVGRVAIPHVQYLAIRLSPGQSLHVHRREWVARTRAKPTDKWIFQLQEEAVSVATENERRTAMALAEDWLQKNKKR
jgi:ABC-type sugar transport system substrate-binding protein